MFWLYILKHALTQVYATSLTQATDTSNVNAVLSDNNLSLINNHAIPSFLDSPSVCCHQGDHIAKCIKRLWYSIIYFPCTKNKVFHQMNGIYIQ